MKLSKINKEILICLGGGISQIPLIKAAKKKYQLIVVDRDKKCPGKKLTEIFFNISTDDENKIILKIDNLNINKNLIKGVINRSSGKAILTMAKIQKKLKLNGSNPEMVKKTLNKKKFIVHCLRNNILTPKIFGEKIRKPVSNINFPVIVKPSVSKIGKKGISIVEKKENLHQAINLSRKYSENNSLIIQEKIDGKDIVLLGAVKNNKFLKLTIIDEINLVNNNIVSRFCYQNPSKNLNIKIKNQIIKIANKIIKIFKLNNCPLSLSFRINKKNKPYLIEINLEISGELIHEKLIKTKDKRFSSFDWYLNALFLNEKNSKPLTFLNKRIMINDKILRLNNAE
tara:strand:+ start:456 stop:1481 length:1026 start_codon:yes stop_codon:yes gene_type:complete